MPERPGLGEIADRVAQATRLETVVGRPSVLWAHQRLQRNIPGVAAGASAVQDRVPADQPAPDDEPLFIFSAGWRSGSTLLQRLVVSADRHFIWGEPYHQSDVIRRLAESLVPFATGWPRQAAIYAAADGEGGELHDQWIANLYPPVSQVVGAHRALLRELLAPPRAQAGLSWGFKEVRLSAEYAVYLRLLFPRAKFLFLTRDPHDAYSSYRQRPHWFERWPQAQVRTPRTYGQMWRRLAQSFIEYEHPLGAVLIRYEDLIDGGDAVNRLDALLGAPVDRSVLVNRIAGSSRVRAGGPTALELNMLDRATRPTARRLGYGVPVQGPS